MARPPGPPKLMLISRSRTGGVDLCFGYEGAGARYDGDMDEAQI